MTDRVDTRGLNAHESEFAALWDAYYPTIDLYTQYTDYNPKKRCPLDFAHLPSRTGIEIQGGVWMQKGGHSSGTGILRDYQKARLALSHGWAIVPVSTQEFTQEVLATVKAIIDRRQQDIAAADPTVGDEFL